MKIYLGPDGPVLGRRKANGLVEVERDGKLIRIEAYHVRPGDKFVVHSVDRG